MFSVSWAGDRYREAKASGCAVLGYVDRCLEREDKV